MSLPLHYTQKQNILQLKGKVFELLEVLLEEINDYSSSNLEQIRKDFCICNVLSSMHQLWEMIETLKNDETCTSEADEHYQEDLYRSLYHGFHAIRRLQSMVILCIFDSTMHDVLYSALLYI